MKTKQVIVIRKDLNMRKGKCVSQGSHASMGALLSMFKKNRTRDESTKYELEFNDDTVLNDWLNGKFTKICVSVDSEEELMDIYNSVPDFCPVVLITDAGLTEFNGIPTKTCLGIGPYISEEIDKITGHLKLL